MFTIADSVLVQNIEDHEVQRRNALSSPSSITSLPIANGGTTIRNTSWFLGASNVSVHGGTFCNNETTYNIRRSRQEEEEIVMQLKLLTDEISRMRIEQEAMARQQECEKVEERRREAERRRLESERVRRESERRRRESERRRREFESRRMENAQIFLSGAIFGGLAALALSLILN
ncbi:hypothetical protein CVT26_006224 [Gymnopilus dilepis]|uniref:Uncharacterized protein n=1 Tax=Gymnopilus dilepis TaxID=231916 RepID=A0A409X6J9_9AGAR|nr:hypothetical protein CVT26_006224 [Gymnopilus dilepis]